MFARSNLLPERAAATALLEANPDKIYWTWLPMNPAAIALLEANQDKIDWDWLSFNTYNYTSEKINAFNSLNLLPLSRLKI